MNRLVAWFAGNPVAANLLMIVFMAGGLLTLPTVRREVFPEITPEMIVVTVPYPGATPAEAEEGICIRVEEAIQDLTGIRRITSRAVEGAGAVTVEVERNADVRRLLEDVRTRVGAITTFPEEAESAVVRLIDLRRQVVFVAVAGPLDEGSLKRLAERVRDDLQSIPGITQAEVVGARPYEISIEISEERLRRHGLTFDEVAAAVRRSSLNLPGGQIRTSAGDLLVRTTGQAYRGREFEELTVIARPDGSRVRLGDVARVSDAFADTDHVTRFNGHPALLVRVFRVGDQNALEISEAVEKYVKEASRRMPPGVQVTPWADESRILRGRLDLLLRNGRTGLILVFACLALFLRLRLAFWVTLGIPTAFLGAMWLMPAADVSINLLSLFAFIVTLGIVVDDAIVVSENIYTHVQSGKPGPRAAVDGATEVGVPVLLAMLTTVAAFLPMLMIPGTMGQFARAIPIIVSLCLTFSILESLFVLPAHLRHLKPSGGARGPWAWVQAKFSGGLDWFIRRTYRPALAVATRYRYATLAAGLAALLLVGGLVAGGRIKFVFFPSVEADNIVCQLTMPEGTPPAATLAVLKKIEDSVIALQSEIEGPGAPRIFVNRFATVGSQPFRNAARQNAGGIEAGVTGGHLAEVIVELTPAEERDVSSARLAARWRELVGAVPDVTELTFTADLMSGGAVLDLQLTSPDDGALRAAADRLKGKLGEFDGVFDIADSQRPGKEELRMRLRPSAEPLGLTMADLARQVRQAFHGEEAQRILRGRDELKVMVRYPEAARRTVEALEGMQVRLPSGTGVPFREVAEVVRARSPSVITRTDRRRSLNVTADLDRSRANENEIVARMSESFLPELRDRHPGLQVEAAGRQRDQRETLASMGRGTVLALLMIYALLAIPFRSYLQPAVVMFAIPFAMAGAVVSHLMMGLDLTMLSIIGIMALMGVAVNDSLVMVDFINRGRRQGRPFLDSVMDAGPRRFRPILLTSLTTFAGLAPMIAERSMQAKFLIPMAVSLGFGILFATAVTLIMVPAALLVIEDAARQLRRIPFLPKGLFEEEPPPPGEGETQAT